MNDLENLIKMKQEDRTRAFFNIVKQQGSLFILADDLGSVMLTSDDDDCVPVWPNEDAAALWQTDEWSNTTVRQISIKDWNQKWTTGMQKDDLCVVVFPLPNEENLIYLPEEFAHYLF